MVYFLLGAALGFVLQKLVWQLVVSATGALRARHPLRPIISRLQPRAVFLVLIAVALFLLAAIADLSLLESARNIRLTFGTVFGWLIGLLTTQKRERSPNLNVGASGAMGGLSDHGQANLASASEPAEKGPWWVRPSSLIAIAVIVLPLFAAIAPHGELDLGFLRSVKTPFLEAQFAQNEVELRLDLKSEPQGLFKLTERGLAEAIYMAYYDFIYQRLLDNGAYWPEKVASPADALRFITDVLQPAALCAHEIDLIYGDQEVLVAGLRIIGTGLSRALALSKNALKQEKQQEAGTGANDAIKNTLMLSLMQFDDKNRELLDSMMPAVCTKLISERFENFLLSTSNNGNNAHTLSALLRNPAVVHAASMFFLWSGSPQAVLKVLEYLNTIDTALQNEQENSLMNYPPISYVRGFANRWEENVSYHGYLNDWDKAIDGFQERLNTIKSKKLDALQKCTAEKILPISKSFSNAQSTTLPQNRSALKEKEVRDDDIHLLYGYYTYWLQKMRNHRMYETAREILANKYSDYGDAEINHALGYAKDAKAFVEADGLKVGNCFTRQQLAMPRDNGTSPAVTTSNPDQEYASAIDGYGLLMLAKAFRTDTGDKELLESAIAHFDDALGYRKDTGSPDRFWDTIRDHRATARRALGLPSR